MLGGCVNLVNSELENVDIVIKNAKCPNSIESLNTNGNINFIEIKNSALDAFDAEFSNIKIKDIKVLKTNGECIGIKKVILKF